MSERSKARRHVSPFGEGAINVQYLDGGEVEREGLEQRPDALSRLDVDLQMLHGEERRKLQREPRRDKLGPRILVVMPEAGDAQAARVTQQRLRGRLRGLVREERNERAHAHGHIRGAFADVAEVANEVVNHLDGVVEPDGAARVPGLGDVRQAAHKVQIMACVVDDDVAELNR